MKHFLVTRFNLRHEEWKTDKKGSVVLTDKWLDERFELFFNYCLPSVINQKNQNFTWIVLFDSKTPSQYKSVIDKISADYKNFRALFIDDMKLVQFSLKQFISKVLNDKDDFIITTRLDNDDSIHYNFIETIQKLAIKKADTVIDLRRGYQLNVSNNYFEYRKYYNSFNPFISVIESTASFNTIHCGKTHRQWMNSRSIIVYDETPLWIEVIHNRNKYNSVRSSTYFTRKINLDDFGIIKELKERNYAFVWFNNMKLTIKKFL